MDGHLFIARGDITQLAAHAIAYSTSTRLGAYGALYPAFRDHVSGFAEWFDELGRDRGDGCQVGETFWMPLAPDARPCGVVVVVAAGGPRTDEDKARIAVRSAIGTAVPRLREVVGPDARLLIALPTFRIGMGGDRDHQLRSARAQVKAALESLERHAAVDVAIVTYTSGIYQIFLEARRQVLGHPQADPGYPRELERALVDGECVLFVGAGLSRGAGLPDWCQLLERMARELGISSLDRLDHLDLAQWYREQFTPVRLAEVIRQTFGNQAVVSRPTLAHFLLMSLPIRYVITTNYDDLLERALLALKRHPVKVVCEEDVARMELSNGVHVIKLHGDASQAEGIVLCRDDYDEFFDRRPAMALLLEGLLLNQTFFFVGYGLRDPNFRQVYSRIVRMLRDARKPAFATSFESAGDAGRYVARQWRTKQLHLVGIPGATPDEQERHLLRLLDRLADRVTSRSPRLFLARDVEVARPLARIHELMQEVGEELVTLGRGTDSLVGSTNDVHQLAEILGFLAGHGWRPPPRSGATLSALWLWLASSTEDPAERRRLLIAALETAEGFHEVNIVRHQLVASEGDCRADRPGTHGV